MTGLNYEAIGRCKVLRGKIEALSALRNQYLDSACFNYRAVISETSGYAPIT
ncbi:hypothetical protein Xbed_03677 [Xenorhabdus beddingii]|uniref:Uncharacterized protein n=1 Tax=Xenorhabdus beddingii TaxID=40578 RepID=A0A1Y2S9W2_9GAMM|nr:hypothetical protein Xbed_03677 [Xenorhabdus beddingii]